MDEKAEQDSNAQRPGHAIHPLEGADIILENVEIAFDLAEAVLVSGDGLGGFSRFVLGSARSNESVIDLGNHRRH
jgi:hypothetical protein